MKKYSFYIVCVTTLLCLFSCKKYLDVQPKDKFLESQVFSSENGIQSALNSIYLGLAKNSLYGGSLTMSRAEVRAQRFNISNSSHVWRQYSLYNYDDQSVQSSYDNTWSDAYSLILNINNLIKELNTTRGILNGDKVNILKGEAFALRAFLHFDLLRIFGPVLSASSNTASIPYYKKATATPSAFSTAQSVIENVLADLDSAATLLKDDPIITEGVLHEVLNDENDFYRYRNLRMNYYAVRALKARVNIYAGNNSSALADAKAVIEQAQNWFPWTEFSKVISELDNPDRIFSSEIIFGVQNMNIYNQQDAFFNSNLSARNIMAPVSQRLEITYENNENDYRYNPCWKLPTLANQPFKTFFKYADVLEPSMDFRFMQPLIRMSEMYYIVAELDPDPESALEHLNTVRFNRGLTDLPEGVNMDDEIQKEYEKEFFGEGQLFFYYKRKAVGSIPNGSASSGNVAMSEDQYVVPVPRSETEYR